MFLIDLLVLFCFLYILNNPNYYSSIYLPITFTKYDNEFLELLEFFHIRELLPNNNDNILIQLNPNKVISIDKFNYRSKVAKNISIQRFDENVMTSRLDAKQMEWKDNSWLAKEIIFRSRTQIRRDSSR